MVCSPTSQLKYVRDRGVFEQINEQTAVAKYGVIASRHILDCFVSDKGTGVVWIFLLSPFRALF